jgi:hypothetical protein
VASAYLSYDFSPLRLVINLPKHIDVLNDLMQVKFKIELSVNSLTLALVFSMLFNNCFNKFSLTYLNPMQVIVLLINEPLRLVLLILQDLHSLSEVTIDILYSSLTLSVVDDHADFDCFIWIVQNTFQVCLDVDVVLGLHTLKAAFGVLQLTTKIKLLILKILDGLPEYLVVLHLFIVLVFLFFDFLHVGYSL